MVQSLKTTKAVALKEKLKKQAGFTLVELLIVVAIIAILAAIAIPAYTTQMERARESTDASNARAAASMAAADYLLNNYSGTATYTFGLTANGNIEIIGATGMTGTAPTYGSSSAITAQSGKCSGVELEVDIKDGGVVDRNSWTALLS